MNEYFGNELTTFRLVDEQLCEPERELFRTSVRHILSQIIIHEHFESNQLSLPKSITSHLRVLKGPGPLRQEG